MVKKNILKYRFNMLILAFLGFIIAGIKIGIPYLIGIYLDKLNAYIQVNTIYRFIKIFIILICAELIIMYIHEIYQAKTSTRFMNFFNHNILDYMKKLPLPYFQNLDTSYMTQRINIDCFTLTSFVLATVLNIFIEIAKVLVILIFIFKMDTKIFSRIILGIPLYAILYKGFKNTLYRRDEKLKDAQGKYFAMMHRQISNVKFIKINSWFNILSQQLRERFESLYAAAIQYYRVETIFTNINVFISRLALIVFLFYGGLEVLRGNISIGNFIIIESYIVILFESISSCANFFKEYQEALVSYRRLDEIMSVKPENNGDIYIKDIENIKLNDINFSYDESPSIIDNISYTFEKGKVYMFIGDNGTGKSTLVNLILGLYQKYEGKITYNDISIGNLDLYRIRKNDIAVVEQEPILLNDTIRNNLSYGNENINNEEIEKLSREIGLYDFIDGLDNKLDTIIDGNNVNLSGGQKQRVALIRAFLKDGDLIILDEPTSALDAEGINSLKKIINKISKDKIIIIVSHDKAIMDVADRIIDFNKKDELVGLSME